MTHVGNEWLTHVELDVNQNNILVYYGSDIIWQKKQLSCRNLKWHSLFSASSSVDLRWCPRLRTAMLKHYDVDTFLVYFGAFWSIFGASLVRYDMCQR